MQSARPGPSHSSSILRIVQAAIAAVASILILLVAAKSASAHQLSWLKADGIAGRVAERLAVQHGFDREDSFPACRRRTPHRFACKLYHWGVDPYVGPHGAFADCVVGAAVFYPNATTRTARIRLGEYETCKYHYYS